MLWRPVVVCKIGRKHPHHLIPINVNLTNCFAILPIAFSHSQWLSICSCINADCLETQFDFIFIWCAWSVAAAAQEYENEDQNNKTSQQLCIVKKRKCFFLSFLIHLSISILAVELFSHSHSHSYSLSFCDCVMHYSNSTRTIDAFLYSFCPRIYIYFASPFEVVRTIVTVPRVVPTFLIVFFFVFSSAVMWFWRRWMAWEFSSHLNG